ncbi:MAG: DUF4142 domain-containing protein [Chitinophagaceae bacterium]|nr:DUF4142 domain-containing protein [Chitinophagaceae bacterium]
MKRVKSYLGMVAAFLGLALMYNPIQAQTLTDGEIASIAVSANQIDVNYAKVALKKSHNKAVRAFANSMIKDHEGVIKQAVALATKEKITPKTNATTKSLLAGEAKEMKVLNSKSGKAFDKAYIDNEVGYHEAVISTVQNTLIPQTKNEQLKNLFVAISPVLNEHLEHAKHIQAELAK